MNLPNLLTLLRLALIPVLVALLAVGESPGLAVGAAAIFVSAAFTDWLDGYVARRRKEVTDLGKLLDPIADKLLILSALVMLVEAGRIPGWLVILILAREFAVTGLRAVAAAGGRVLAAERLGKLKMVAQTIAVLVLILEPVLPVWAHTLGLGLLLAATALAILSASRYAVQYGRSLGPAAAR
jgi:CDP-diacylglycerol--glycerol-3-phosphate 3-phosphatidyltransferase